MEDLQHEAFAALFREAFTKCFHIALQNPLTETESRHFANRVFEATGLIIGAKSIKNYAAYIAGTAETKRENPSVATLDTFARYVLDAPYTDETGRRKEPEPYAYWFRYRNQFAHDHPGPGEGKRPVRRPVLALLGGLVLILLLIFLVIRVFRTPGNGDLVDRFSSLSDDSLAARGWLRLFPDETWWRKKDGGPGLTLFTLTGDNWPDSAHTPAIRNLLVHRISPECFSAEVHFENFLPEKEWQQAGLLLMEDTVFSAPCVRLSIAYNDYFGGFREPDEIILQAIRTGGTYLGKPEEIGHLTLFRKEADDSLIRLNMAHATLRIEKTGKNFQFLYAVGAGNNNALREAFSHDLPFRPKYIGIFALQGYVKDTAYLPVHVSYFSLLPLPCNR